ncbi:MAG: GYD domain-containing protein, partial [Bryobacteraceae bacterium]
MASCLFQISYSAEAWAAMIKHPQDRVSAVSKAVEKLGGKVGSLWMAFGEYDLIGVLEMPDNVSAAAFAVAVAGGGACKNVKTTPL